MFENVNLTAKFKYNICSNLFYNICFPHKNILESLVVETQHKLHNHVTKNGIFQSAGMLVWSDQQERIGQVTALLTC